jgi:hypothetical protein
MIKWLTSDLPIGCLLSGKGKFKDYMIVLAIIASLDKCEGFHRQS